MVSANVLAVSIIANPSPASLVHAFAAEARDVLRSQAFEFIEHDLYAEGFNPVQPTGELHNTVSNDPLVERHCADIVAADLILIFHPNWWGQPPAILKGWIDRVLRLGTAYGYPPGVPPEGVPVGLLRARHAVIVNTSNTPPQREAEAFGDPLDAIWRRCIFPLCGVNAVTRRMYGPVAGSTADQRTQWLTEMRQLIGDVAQNGGRKDRIKDLR
jgi:putative NADPH-quinone reductase